MSLSPTWQSEPFSVIYDLIGTSMNRLAFDEACSCNLLRVQCAILGAFSCHVYCWVSSCVDRADESVKHACSCHIEGWVSHCADRAHVSVEHSCSTADKSTASRPHPAKTQGHARTTCQPADGNHILSLGINAAEIQALVAILASLGMILVSEYMQSFSCMPA